MTELLEAVDELTLPRNVKIPTDDGHTWATEDPLLDQLVEAIASGLGSPSGGTTAPWARNLLDGDALYTAALITSQIGDWCRMVGVVATRNAQVDLRAWYDAFAKTEGAALDTFYTNMLTKWAKQIKAMLNPPKTLEMTCACPECQETYWINIEGNPVPHPIALNYWANGVTIWADAKATCRACGKEWEGEWELRALRHDIDAMDAKVRNI